MLLRVTVNLAFVVFCVEGIQRNIRSLRSPSCKKEVTPLRNRQLKSSTISSLVGNENGETNDFYSLQGFPDVIYPTSTYEASQPFYYKTGGSDNILGPFSEDVKSTYKLISDSKKNRNKPSASEVIKYKTVVVPSKQEMDELLNVVVNTTFENFDEDNDYSHCSDVVEKNETQTNSNTLPKEPIFIDVIYNEGSPLESPTLELIPPHVPVRLKVNIELRKDDFILQENVNITENIETNDFTDVNETIASNTTEEITYLDYLEKNISDDISLNENNITILDEINDTDFISALSILLFDSLSNKPIVLPNDGITNEEFQLHDSRECTLNVMNDTNYIDTYKDFPKPINISDTELELFMFKENNILEEGQSIKYIEKIENYEEPLCNVHTVQTVNTVNNTSHISNKNNKNKYARNRINTNVER